MHIDAVGVGVAAGGLVLEHRVLDVEQSRMVRLAFVTPATPPPTQMRCGIAGLVIPGPFNTTSSALSDARRMPTFVNVPLMQIVSCNT